MSPKRVLTTVDGRELSLSNLDKVLYPSGFTKGEMLDYYARIADVMVPHLKDRPVTFKRFPNGVDGMSFYEKHAPSNRPEWTSTVRVPSKEGHEPIEYVVVNDRATLMWAANLAAIEFHVPLWHVARRKALPAPPDHMVFDLDPGPGATIADCCEVAQWIAQDLDRNGVLAKTSGSKGLQLYSPVHRVNWERESERAHEIAQKVERDHRDRVVSVMRKDLRNDKVLIDWSQNSSSKTTVAAYSLRARPEPTVSTPVTWDEVDRCAQDRDANQLRFETRQVLSRVEKFGDLMATLTHPVPSRKLTTAK